MGKELLRHEIIRRNGGINILAMNSNSHTHKHMLRALDDFAWMIGKRGKKSEVGNKNKKQTYPRTVDSEQIRSFQRLESKEIVIVVSVVDNGRVEYFSVPLYNLEKVLGHQRSILLSVWVDMVVKIFHN